MLRKLAALALLAGVLIAGLAWGKDAIAPPIPAAAAPSVVGAESALLMDAETGVVLWEQNGYLRRSMASTTKIMTAMVLLEKGKLDDQCTVSQRAVETEHAYLLFAGERLTLLELLKAMLINSANDAAVAAAEHVFGSEAKCVAQMNRMARQLGARDTHFVNVHGLYDPDHYSTAYDLALIARAAMKRKLFRELVGTRVTTISLKGRPGWRVLENRNHLLGSDLGVDGIKTGFVNDSGHCLVFSVKRGGCHLIGVLLKSPYIWHDAKLMIWQAGKAYRPRVFALPDRTCRRLEVSGGKADRVPVYTEARLAAFVPTHGRNPYEFRCAVDGLSAPVRKGEVIGRAQVVHNGRVLRSVPLYAAAAVERSPWATICFTIRVILLIFLVAVISAYACRASAKASGRRRRRLAAQMRGADQNRADFGQRESRFGTRG